MSPQPPDVVNAGLPRADRAPLARRAARAAVWALRPDGPSTAPLTIVTGPDLEHVRRTLDLALRVAESLLGSGASANDTVDATLRLTKAYGLRGVHVDVTFTAISISWHRGAHSDPISVVRVVRARGIDYTRLQRLESLVKDAREGLPVEAARARYDEIVRAPRMYRRWVVVAANGLLAGGVCILFSASWVVGIVAMLASSLIDLLQGFVLARRLPPFFAQALGGAVPTLAAAALLAAAKTGAPALHGVRPSLVVAAGIVLMLSGLSTVGAAQDAIDGFYVTAAARSFEVMMMTLGIVTGIVAMLHVAARANLDLSVSTESLTFGPVPMQLLGAFVIALSFAVSTGAGPRSSLLCAVMGVLGWTGYLVAAELGLGPIGASAVGATAAGFVGPFVSTRIAIPSLALTTSAVVPLMPGLMVFLGLLQLVSPNAGVATLSEGILTLLGAASVGVALAAGVSLGTYLARPMARRRTRAPERVRTS